MTTEEQLMQLAQQAQNHTLNPLNALVLGLIMQLPAPLDWKLHVYNSFASYLAPIHLSPMAFTVLIILGPIGLILLLLATAYIIFRLIKWSLPLVFRLSARKKQESVLLELTFPSDTTKSAYATEQLYRLVHTVGRQLSLQDKLAKNKKLYALELIAT